MPPQHDCDGSPQGAQKSLPGPVGGVPLTHWVLVWQVGSAPLWQQEMSSVPHAWHWLLRQVRLLPQVGVSEQQGSLSPPQPTQVPARLQIDPAQQGWPPPAQLPPLATQTTHLPVMSGASQANPDDWQRGVVGQHGWLSRPQPMHIMAVPQVWNACGSQLQLVLQPFLSRPQ